LRESGKIKARIEIVEDFVDLKKAAEVLKQPSS